MDVLGAIERNPVLALLLVLIPVVAGLWRVFQELYVKPRDQRIDYLKEDMARLKADLDEMRSAQAARADSSPRLSQTASIAKSVDALPSPAEPAVLRIRELAHTGDPEEASDAGQAQRALRSATAPAKGATSMDPLRSLRACYEQWNSRANTDLQKKNFETQYIGRAVAWDVWIDSVSPASHGQIGIAVRDTGQSFLPPRAIVYYSEALEAQLLALKKGDRVHVKGIIKEFFLWPSLEGNSISALT